MSLLVVGYKEWIDLPEWGLSRVKCKLDSGACTSALDVRGYDLETTGAGQFAIIHIAPYRKHPELLRVVRAAVLKRVRVRNTSGRAELRLVVRTAIQLGAIRREIPITLADRQQMLCPIILGRSALSGAFLVDCGRKFLATAQHDHMSRSDNTHFFA